MSVVIVACILLGAAALFHGLSDRTKARQQDAIARALSVVSTPAAGPSGKGAALEYLNAQGLSLGGINLSCARMGGGWDGQRLTCDRPTGLQKVALHKADLVEAQLQGADLSGAQLQEADLVGAQLQGAALGGAQLQQALLGRARLQRADLSGAQLQGADLRFAILSGAHLSHADFTGARSFDEALFRDPDTGLSAWAWADRPPTGLAGVEVALCVFHRNRHTRRERPTDCTPPVPFIGGAGDQR